MFKKKIGQWIVLLYLCSLILISCAPTATSNITLYAPITLSEEGSTAEIEYRNSKFSSPKTLSLNYDESFLKIEHLEEPLYLDKLIKEYHRDDEEVYISYITYFQSETEIWFVTGNTYSADIIIFDYKEETLKHITHLPSILANSLVVDKKYLYFLDREYNDEGSTVILERVNLKDVSDIQSFPLYKPQSGSPFNYIDSFDDIQLDDDEKIIITYETRDIYKQIQYTHTMIWNDGKVLSDSVSQEKSYELFSKKHTPVFSANKEVVSLVLANSDNMRTEDPPFFDARSIVKIKNVEYEIYWVNHDISISSIGKDTFYLNLNDSITEPVIQIEGENISGIGWLMSRYFYLEGDNFYLVFSDLVGAHLHHQYIVKIDLEKQSFVEKDPISLNPNTFNNSLVVSDNIMYAIGTDSQNATKKYYLEIIDLNNFPKYNERLLTLPYTEDILEVYSMDVEESSIVVKYNGKSLLTGERIDSQIKIEK